MSYPVEPHMSKGRTVNGSVVTGSPPPQQVAPKKPPAGSKPIWRKGKPPIFPKK